MFCRVACYRSTWITNVKWSTKIENQSRTEIKIEDANFDCIEILFSSFFRCETVDLFRRKENIQVNRRQYNIQEKKYKETIAYKSVIYGMCMCFFIEF